MSNRKKLSHELNPDTLKRRDRKELLGLAGIYLYSARCCGGHLVHKGFCCPWCGSDDPGSKCHLTNVTSDQLETEWKQREKERGGHMLQEQHEQLKEKLIDAIDANDWSAVENAFNDWITNHPDREDAADMIMTLEEKEHQIEDHAISISSMAGTIRDM